MRHNSLSRLIRTATALAILATFGCTYDSASLDSVRCDEGDVEPDRICRGGFWVGVDVPDATALDMRSPTDMPVVLPDDMSAPDMATPDMRAQDMGEPDAGSPDMRADMTQDMCTPESDGEFCQRVKRGAECGTLTGTDNCGDPRADVSCPGVSARCAEGSTCVANMCMACTPEANLCEGKVCGEHMVMSASCGEILVKCGPGETTACAQPQDVCLDDGSCCMPETEQQLCAAMPALECGSAQVMDSCGKRRMVSCGSCGADQECKDNQCSCEDVPQTACQGLCGTVTNACNSSRDCGGCGVSQACNSANMCECTITACGGSQVCGRVDACGSDLTCGALSCAGNSVCDAHACEAVVEITSQGILTASQDSFGESVAISGDLIAVGAPRSQGSRRGSVTLFTRDYYSRSWGAQHVLLSLPPSSPCTTDCLFGTSVALDEPEQLLIVGAPGENKAYAFALQPGGTWTLEHTFAPLSNAQTTPGMFGHTVAMDGNRVIIGDPTSQRGGVEVGAAYVYERTGGTWGLLKELVDPTMIEESKFGWDVDVDGARVAIGAPGRVTTGSSPQGQTWIFEESAASTWAVMPGAPLTSALISGGDYMGFSVSLNGDGVASGIPDYDSSKDDSGAAVLHGWTGTTWALVLDISSTIDASRQDYDSFGYDVALGDTAVIVGYPGVEAIHGFDNMQGQGSRSGAFIYTVANPPRRFAPTQNQKRYTGLSVASDADVIVLGAPGRTGQERDRIYILRQQ